MLSSTIYVLQENWRTFIRKPVDAPQGQGAVAATLAAMAARQTNTGASVYERQAQQAAASKEEALLQKVCPHAGTGGGRIREKEGMGRVTSLPVSYSHPGVADCADVWP